MNRAVLVSRVSPMVGYIILSGMTLGLFGLAVLEAWTGHPIAGAILTLAGAGLAFGTAQEGLALHRTGITSTWDVKDLYRFVAVLAGAVITYILNVDLGLGAVVASGLVGVLAAVLLPDYGVPLYCGSFVGMASPTLLPNHIGVAAAGAVAGLVFVLCIDLFDGFGGKLGTIALSGCVLVGLHCGAGFVSLPVLHWHGVEAWMVIICSALAAIATFYISIHLGRGPVMASGLVGLVGGLLLPPIYPNMGDILAVMVICASFAGMSGIRRFSTAAPIAVAGLLAGLLFIYSAPHLGGAGGKLGTIAFGSVIAVRGVSKLIRALRELRPASTARPGIGRSNPS
ncbi:MAG TPA: hypothetical protein GX702_09835 [Chloroflexi bacterium]|jgi:hypothetical protein|nr:hypothetical protein [Chloroflexota bacterium]